MDTLEAIAAAKNYLSEVYAEEKITNISLEEVQHVLSGDNWVITLGFARPWNTPRTRAQEVLENLGTTSPLRRSLKVITLTDDGTVLSMKDAPKAESVE
jgi:hypothetical protein